MSAEAKARAEELRERPDVQRWIKRLKRLANDMPEDVSVYCESGAPFVMALAPTRDKRGGLGYETETGGVDQDSVIEAIPQGRNGGGWDGGGW